MKIAFIIARKEIMSYDSLNRHKKDVWTHIKHDYDAIRHNSYKVAAISRID